MLRGRAAGGGPAHGRRGRGLPGNHPRYFELLWAAHRIGLYYTTISRHLKREEAQYIIADCDARVLFHSSHTPGRTRSGPAGRGGRDPDLDGRRGGGRGGLRRLAGASARGRVAAGHARGHGFPVFLRHHRPAQGHQAPIGAGQPLFPRRRGAQQRLEGLRPRHGLPVHRAVLPCRAGALEHGRAARRRQLRDDAGEVRRRRRAGGDRRAPGHAFAMGADYVHPAAAPAGRGTRAP